MKLKALRVENFKSIYDSGRFELDNVTCLVGKNEAGKTALLQSLYKLNPVIPSDTDFVPMMEYPRRKWMEYQVTGEEAPNDVLTTEWELDEVDRQAIENELGPGALTSNLVTIIKGYNGVFRGSLSIDEQKMVEYLLASSRLSTDEKQPINDTETVQALIVGLEAEESPSTGWKQLTNTVKSRFPDGEVNPYALHLITERIPTILYFSNYYQLPGQISIDEILSRRDTQTLDTPDQMFLALLDLAGIKPEQLSTIGQFEQLTTQLEAVSVRLGKTVFDYWSQNPYVDVEFRFDPARAEDPPPFNVGNVARIRIRNRLHGISVGFDERSSGFVWFFSFLVWFSQIHRTFGDNLLILLDEPAINLHARAQQDLLRYIANELEPKFQVIYSTHSPFMVDAQNLTNIRTVEDVVGPNEEVLGTKVSLPGLTTDPDTVFPVQAALGYDITRNLHAGEHTLLVDNPSDLLYITWFSRELQRLGNPGLDSRWVISPLGGLQKVASLVALFGSDKGQVAVLTTMSSDNDKSGGAGLLKEGSIFSPGTYTKQVGSTIEDMIGRTTFMELVNRAYGLYGSRKIPLPKAEDTPLQVVAEVMEHFRGPDLSSIEFDPYFPALNLLQQGVGDREKLPNIEQALDHFEALFADLNRLLNS